MRTLLTLYNNVLNGLFPDHTAKPATTPTAKDGTPLKAINIDDLIIGWIQALFFQTGNATPNGNPELKDDSQIIDLMRQLFSTAEKQTINASGPVVFGPTNHEIEVDLSLGNISIDQLPVPDFIGQKIHIYGVGPFVGDIAGGTGVYVNGIFFTETTAGVFGTAISLTEWRFENSITADYVSGSTHIKKRSDGELIMSGEVSQSISTTTAELGGFRSSTVTISFPINYADTTYLRRQVPESVSDSVSVYPLTGKLVGSYGIAFWNGASSGAAIRIVSWRTEGAKY